LGQVNLFSWIGVSFSLGSTAILAWSKAYGVFDIKWLFLAHIVMFEVGSAICGAAPTMPALIIGRVVAGFGGCGMYSGSLTYIAALTSIHERPLYTAGIAVIWGLGSVLGPVVRIWFNYFPSHYPVVKLTGTTGWSWLCQQLRHMEMGR
jgi:MFS family permease